MKTPRTLILAACALALNLVACGLATDEEDTLSEATAALLADEETGDVAKDALVDADLEGTADEDVAPAESTEAPAFDVCDFQARRQMVLEKYDADGDGKLSRDEAQKLREELGVGDRPRMFRLRERVRHHAFLRVRWAFDENADRVLDDEERANLIAAMEARCERRRQAVLEKFDADQDGQLSDTERQAARDAAKARFQAWRADLLAKYDANTNGMLDYPERLRLRADRIETLRARRQAVIAQYDTNGDGRLSPEEALPLKKEIQRRIAEGLDAE